MPVFHHSLWDKVPNLIPPVFGKAPIENKTLISRLNLAFFTAASKPNTSRDGGTGREDVHYSIISNPEKKS
jgi:hypothetical protein